MLRHDSNYTRLPGGGSTLSGQATYWLAKDHLLLVEVQFATERYRRFNLEEIQTVIIRRTQDHDSDAGLAGSAPFSDRN